ncbi:MAG TPA: hypothetical protein VEC60_08955, partial [Reyranella sp.]|nr:hypothetical protein [Reyranella sp.]
GGVCVCRNTFHAGMYTMGGNDPTAAGTVEEYADNNTFLKPYTPKNGAAVSGAGWYRRAVPGRASVGHNTIVGSSLIGGIVDGSAAGGDLSLRPNLILGYNTGDGEPIPTASTSAVGMTPAGVPFGPYSGAITLGKSAVAVPHTGDTIETALASIAVPAGIMGKNGTVYIDALYSYTNSANNKTQRIRFGGMSGTQYVSAVTTTTATVRYLVQISNRGAENSQVGPGMAAIGTASTASPVTGSINTAAATTIEITGQLANSGETITLERYSVILVPGY